MTETPPFEADSDAAAPQAVVAPEASVEPSPAEVPAAAPAPAPAEPTPAETAAKLAELFPALFGGPPQPIKLRIQADIQQRAPGVFSKRALSVFLHRHTTSTAYLKALIAAPQRLDLDGAPAGELAPEHLEAAKTELERRRGIAKARREAEAQARRDAEREAFKQQRQAQRDQQQHGRREAAQARQAQQARWEEDAARRERALLLRAFESSPLNKANFCVLRRISEADLDAQLAQARAERDAWQRQQAPQRSPPGGAR